MGTFCGVAYWDLNTSQWRWLIKDQCNALRGRTFNITNFPANSSFYLKLQYDCELYVGYCTITFEITYSYTPTKSVYTATAPGPGGPVEIDIPFALPSPPYSPTPHTVTVKAYEGNTLQDYFNLSISTIQPGYIVIDYVWTDKSVVNVNESFAVYAALRNPGDTSATRIIYLKINNSTVQQKTVTLYAKQTKTEVFTTSISTPGTHNVCVE